MFHFMIIFGKSCHERVATSGKSCERVFRFITTDGKS